MIDLDAIRRSATRLGKVNILVGIADFEALVKEVERLQDLDKRLEDRDSIIRELGQRLEATEKERDAAREVAGSLADRVSAQSDLLAKRTEK